MNEPIAVSPVDSLLAQYCAGSLNPALNALVDAHLELSNTNHRFVEELESLKGEAVLAMPPAVIAHRDANLAAIFGQVPDAIESEPECAILPAALQRFAASDYASLKWNIVLPGIWQCKLADAPGMEATLYRIRAGRHIPEHRHEGTEITLVLRGAFRDGEACFRQGDIAFADNRGNHKPVAEPGEDCICFAVIDAPLHLTGPIGRFLDKWVNRSH
ncbi:MAG: ChrR family anti-sigma-E factor [Hyphomicrobiales bacterium]|nr:ChrR family anti-sigma-E factor [Hyphomicrobiales bacterium]MDE2113963.1 ChrR family anti-sigma-E factor [Hyphomicrobiales bacterium]